MRTSAVIVAGVLILAGAVFVGQGTGVIRSSSAMTDDTRWAWIGAAMILVGVVIVGRERHRTSA